jgi:hypothetical protein
MAASAQPAAQPQQAAPVRIFVGGVAAGVTADELAQRFASFGAVVGVEFVAGKAPGECRQTADVVCGAYA